MRLAKVGSHKSVWKMGFGMDSENRKIGKWQFGQFLNEIGKSENFSIMIRRKPENSKNIFRKSENFPLWFMSRGMGEYGGISLHSPSYRRRAKACGRLGNGEWVFKYLPIFSINRKISFSDLIIYKIYIPYIPYSLLYINYLRSNVLGSLLIKNGYRNWGKNGGKESGKSLRSKGLRDIPIKKSTNFLYFY